MQCRRRLLRAQRGARFDHGVNRLLTRAFDRAEAVPQRRAFGLELPYGSLDGGRTHLDAALARVVDELFDLLRVRHLAREVRSQECTAVVGLQIGGLIREHRVGGRMRLVEAVAAELEDVVPDFFCDALLTAVRFRARHELVGELLHDLGLLLAHRLAQVVGFVQREARQGAGDQHDLLLVDDAPVSVAQDRFHRGVWVRDLFLAVLAAREHLDHARLERARSIEREDGDQVLETVGLDATEELFHALGFELEDAQRVAARQQAVRRRITGRKRIEVRRDAALLAHVRERSLEDRQGP